MTRSNDENLGSNFVENNFFFEAFLLGEDILQVKKTFFQTNENFDKKNNERIVIRLNQFCCK